MGQTGASGDAESIREPVLREIRSQVKRMVNMGFGADEAISAVEANFPEGLTEPERELARLVARHEVRSSASMRRYLRESEREWE
jgi:hypothetical protein